MDYKILLLQLTEDLIKIIPASYKYMNNHYYYGVINPITNEFISCIMTGNPPMGVKHQIISTINIIGEKENQYIMLDKLYHYNLKKTKYLIETMDTKEYLQKHNKTFNQLEKELGLQKIKIDTSKWIK